MKNFPWLRVYKPHYFDKNYPPILGCGLYTKFKNPDSPRKSRYPTADWAHDAGIVSCETPSRDR
jgi:hypothetical protein